MKQQMCALVANDPPVYRQLISEALRKLRPLVEVVSAEPEELDEAVRRLQPHLVISGLRRRCGPGACCAWCFTRAKVWACDEASGREGAARHLGIGVGVADLLGVVDEAELPCRSA